VRPGCAAPAHELRVGGERAAPRTGAVPEAARRRKEATMARSVLILAAIIEVVFRGIPALFGSPAVARIFRLEYLEGFIPYVHAFGAVMICLGLLFYFASREPEKYLLVINIAILRFALGIVAQLGSYFQLGSLHVFWWIHMAVDVVLVVLLVVARSSVKSRAVAAP
jgi:hypothetical protein